MVFNPFVSEEPDTATPLAERPIGGLEFHLVQNIMDRANYQRQVNQNIVTLVKFFSDKTPN
jgi:anti-sigma regulatory factor (Ser/Thr protein kinase)